MRPCPHCHVIGGHRLTCATQVPAYLKTMQHNDERLERELKSREERQG